MLTKKEVNMKKIDNKLLIAVSITFVVAGLLGFFGGMYYERQSAAARFQQMRGNFQGRRNGTGTRPQFNGTLPAETQSDTTAN